MGHRNKYVMQIDPRATCATCRFRLFLLTPAEPKVGAGGIVKDPLFYICFKCHKVYQSGVGPVEEVFV